MKFSIGKLLTLIAFIAMLLAIFANMDFSPKPIRLLDETPPVVKLSATHQRHSYETTQEDAVHTILVKSPDYPFSVWPMVEWEFQTSDSKIRHINKNFVLGWDQENLSSEIEINSSGMGGRHFDSTDYGTCRIEQHWSEIRVSPVVVRQNVRLYLIENLENRILKQCNLVIETKLELE